MTEPSEAASKTRIISHMNKDHQDSVIRYAEFYAKVSRFISHNAKLTDISLDKLTISASGQTLTIPLDPPMSSLRDARERLVEMDKQTIVGLQRSPVTLKEYTRPRGFAAVVFVAAFWTYIMLSRRENMTPGSLMYDNLLKYVPWFANFSLMTRNFVLWPMIAIHLAEAYLMTKTLRKHSVPLFSGLWWLWVIDCFIEGVNSFQRISAIEKEKLQKQNKH